MNNFFIIFASVLLIIVKISHEYADTPVCVVGSRAYYANKQDCQAYFFCDASSNEPVPYICPYDLIFSLEDLECGRYPDGACIGCSGLGNFSYEATCEVYAECTEIDGEAIIRTCPEGEYFHIDLRRCAPGNPAACFKCPEGADKSSTNFYPVSSDCSLYYDCTSGDPVLKSCPEDTYFSYKTGMCDADYDNECYPPVDSDSEDIPRTYTLADLVYDVADVVLGLFDGGDDEEE